MKRLRTVSIPRSGNVLLLRYLTEYYNHSQFLQARGTKLASYQEMPLFYSRSHDQRLTDKIYVEDVLTIVQYREPEQYIRSFLHREEVVNPGRVTDLDSTERILLLARLAGYYISFCEKWLRGDSRTYNMVVDYQTIVADPGTILSSLFEKCALEFIPEIFEATRREAETYMILKGELVPYQPPTNETVLLSNEEWSMFTQSTRNGTAWMNWAPPIVDLPDIDQDRLTHFQAQVEHQRASHGRLVAPTQL